MGQWEAWLVGRVVGGGFALRKGGKVVAGSGGKGGVAWDACYLGSSLVERAHNLLNGVRPLGGVEAEEPNQRG